MERDLAIEVLDVEKSFGDVKALDGITFSIERGEIFGLLGPNGAGKTTTIRTILGIILPDSGEIRVNGERFSSKMRDIFGYLPEERGLYRKMRVGDLILFFGRSKGFFSRELHEKIDFWLKKMELFEYKNKKIEELSKGMQQKIQFVITVISNPDIIILDEPFSGLDPINRDLFKEIILDLNGEGKTIIYSTHNMEEAEKLSNSICLINRGKVLIFGKLGEVKEKYGTNSIVVESEDDISFLRDYDFFSEVDIYKNYAEFTLKEGVKPIEILKIFTEKGINLKKFQVLEPSLRRIFVSSVKEEERRAEGVLEN